MSEELKKHQESHERMLQLESSFKSRSNAAANMAMREGLKYGTAALAVSSLGVYLACKRWSAFRKTQNWSSLTATPVMASIIIGHLVTEQTTFDARLNPVKYGLEDIRSGKVYIAQREAETIAELRNRALTHPSITPKTQSDSGRKTADETESSSVMEDEKAMAQMREALAEGYRMPIYQRMFNWFHDNKMTVLTSVTIPVFYYVLKDQLSIKEIPLQQRLMRSRVYIQAIVFGAVVVIGVIQTAMEKHGKFPENPFEDEPDEVDLLMRRK